MSFQHPSAARFGSARSQKRIEDDRLLVGKGLYSDDRELPDQVWMALVRSPPAGYRTCCSTTTGSSLRGLASDWSRPGSRSIPPSG